MKKLRVLTFSRYADDNFGGVERYVFELARSLEGAAEFANIVARRGGAPDTSTGTETVYARPLAHLSGTPICPGMPLHAMRLHRANPFDIVHLQFPADPMAHIAAVALPPTVKRVITWHSDIVRQKTLARLYEPFLDRLLRTAHAIILPTPDHLHSSKQLARWGAKDRLHVVPFGLDYERFVHRPAAADALRRREGDRFLVFALGRHVYYKGLEYLIEAIAKLPQTTLILGGRGPLTETLIALAKQLGVADRVKFVGRIPDAELPAYYHACDVFCLPSVSPAEAFGLVQLEAMACGKPVVACELHNGVTWVNRNEVSGLVVPPADPEALAGALKRLQLDAALRERLGRQARERALREFSIDAMARGTLDVYRNVLQGRVYAQASDTRAAISVKRAKILFLVTEDWYFVSHRLPIALGAQAAGYEVVVATRLGQAARQLEQAGVRTIELRYFQRASKGLWKELRALLELVAVYRDERPDLVHHVALKPVLYGSIAARLSGIRHIVNALAGLGFVFSSRSLRARFWRPVVRAMLRLFAKRGLLILQNPDDRELLLERGIAHESRTRLIRGAGVDVARFSPRPEPGEEPLVILASRMLWDKGVGDFVEMAVRLRGKGVRARFALIGDSDPDNPAAVPPEQLLAWQRSGTVEWWGKRDDMHEILPRATIVTFPSTYGEGVPKVLLEAAASGRAIVAYDMPGTREIVRHKENGLLVPPRSVAALADAVRALLQDHDARRAMGMRGRAIVMEEFREHMVVAQTIAIYDEIVADAR
jgi:glycosyltransferase involved in cell wall biosynthesis